MRELLTKIFNEDYGRMPENLKSDIETELAKPEPISTHFVFKFPTVLRKMWSGTEIQQWLDSLPPLYTHPPAQQKPLSDDEIDNIKYFSIPSDFDNSLRRFAREVEKAHGIK